MTSLLLDSHIFLWLLQEPHKVGRETTRLLQANSQRYVSLATIWELGIKYKKGKLAFSSAELLGAVSSLGMDILKIEDSHIINATNHKIEHRDPFDNLLIAQANTENLKLLTADSDILKIKLDYVLNAKD